MKAIRLETNAGLGNALKIATESCSNELIARMDSDDVASADRFEQQLLFFAENPNVDIVGGDISEFVNDETNIVSYRVLPTSDKELKRFLKKRCPFNHMTVMFKRTSVFNAGGYLDLHYNEDYYLWVRMFLNDSCFANTGSILVNVRVGENMYRRRGGKEYYRSEVFLQKFMLSKRIIGRPRYYLNCSTRFFAQRLLPNRLRGFVFKRFARKNRKYEK